MDTTELTTTYQVTRRDLAKRRNLLIGSIAAPFVLGGVPAIVTVILSVLFGASPSAAITIFFFGFLIAAIGFLAGIVLGGYFAFRRNRYTRELRERIAADGIRADEIDWFRNEMKPGEKRMLDGLRRRDLLLADSYADSVAARMTATRIFKGSKRELQLMQRRKNKLKQLKTESAAEFQRSIDGDIANVSSIRDEAKVMLAEAETRIQMLEAAATRGTSIADSELALKKLSTRTMELPAELERAKLAEEIRRELEAEEKEKGE